MKVATARTPLKYALVVALVITAGCGGVGSKGFEVTISEEPSISNLKITPLDPERVNIPVRYSAQVFVFDFQNDVLGGTCEIDTSVGKFSMRINALSNGAFAVCEFTILVSTPQQIPGSIVVVDRGGHRSNSLGFVLGITA